MWGAKDEVTHRTHIMKTLYFLVGTGCPTNTSANLSKPLPLLVVHSGNTTMGLFTPRLISSKLFAFNPSVPEVELAT